MRLNGKRIAVLVAPGVEDLEFYVPFMRLQEEGADVVGAGINLEPVIGKNGLEIIPDVTAMIAERGCAGFAAQSGYSLCAPGA